MAKMIITIKPFDIGVIDQPDHLEIEFRDYGIGEDDWSEDDPSCKEDSDGKRYQEIIFPIKTKPVVADVEFTVRSYYKHCGEEWDTDWDSACDDECPVCGKAISPYRYEDINNDDENENIEILSHNISYYLDNGSKIEVGDCEHEHIVYMINQGYIEGDLSKAGTHDGEETVRGYWKIEKE